MGKTMLLEEFRLDVEGKNCLSALKGQEFGPEQLIE